ncbi:MAG: MFS transporter [Anaerolineae bacterium]
MSAIAVERPETIGYTRLLRENPQFRRLWLGQVVSNAGDWFNNIAVLGLVLQLTDSAAAAGWVIIAQQIPSFFLSPVSGAIVDRFDRRRVMIAADVLRAVIAMGFLLIRRPDQVWIAYVLGAGLMMLSSFFGPAQTAAIPNLVRQDALISANGLAGSTWGAMLAIGAAIGGLVSAYLGRDVAFVINAVSFLASAALISSIRASFHERGGEGDETRQHIPVWAGFGEALRYIGRRPGVWTLLLVKAGWGVGGGIVLLLSVFATQVFQAGDNGIGLLYAARGLGVLLGPYVIRMFVGNDFRRMRRTISVAFAFVGVFYSLFSLAPTLALAMLMVTASHFWAGTAWVLSSTMLQQLVPDRLRGRVFAIDNGLVMLTIPLSTLVVGHASEVFHPRVVARGTAATFFVTAALYTVLLISTKQRNPTAFFEPGAQPPEHEFIP